ncbi:MAG: aminomethyl-transferring glycine dehydrogenase subunit GcvPA [Planctomycetota bacterium]|jgi:glycine dehydrogenase subunit 1|nr:aminomethyl-transferring glycine dehydrogenase subunit GcvPA [Planctomycetota bacterium]
MTFRYFPHTADDIREMLAAVGVDAIDDLFADIPPECRRDRPLELPGPLDEWELTRRLEEMAAAAGGDWRVFVGGGSQPHRIPALVPALAGRSEFLTAYTPYQPEISQGTLQAIFEFQTLVARLTGLAAANASLYDGATALAEAALMAIRIRSRRQIAVSGLVHPHWREVLDAYLRPLEGTRIVTLPPGADGRTNLSPLGELPEPAVLILQSPNFLGFFEDLRTAGEAIHAAGGLLAAGFSEPFALGLAKNPGELGADLAFGEGQSLGIPQSFGGPGLGLLAARAEFLRQLPGRLVGETIDNRGRRGFVLTLAAREQHIRRARAVSNICSNAGHAALTAAVFMAACGGSGFRKIAQANLDLAEYFKAGLLRIGFEKISGLPTFNEFALRAPAWFPARHAALRKRRVLAGLSLAEYYPEYPGAWLFGVGETRDGADIDRLLEELKP